MGISCDQATKICDKQQYKEASLLERVQLNLHLLFCKKCGLYSKQNNVLTKCYKTYSTTVSSTTVRCLTEDDKMNIKKKLEGKY
jgi:hypothetical protein